LLIFDLKAGVITPQTQIGGSPDSEIRNQQSEIINQSQTKLRVQPCLELFPIPDQRDTAAYEKLWKVPGDFPQNLMRGSIF
jgi:hypothetical protein